MFVDAHCHLDLPAFDGDRDAVIARAVAVGVGGFVVAGINPAGWSRQRQMARTVPGVVWTAGLHPEWVCTVDDSNVDSGLEALPGAFEGPGAARGIGETGLDARGGRAGTLDRQVRAFRAQLATARELAVPVVLHIVGRGAHGRALEVLRGDGVPEPGGMLHAYSGSAEMVSEYGALGLYTSFGGPIVRADARKLHRAAMATPVDRLLVESDAPDLPPPNHASRNEPATVIDVAAALAVLRAATPEEILGSAARNAARLFGSFHFESSDR